MSAHKHLFVGSKRNNYQLYKIKHLESSSGEVFGQPRLGDVWRWYRSGKLDGKEYYVNGGASKPEMPEMSATTHQIFKSRVDDLGHGGQQPH
jgi:hypothetical protein